MNISDFKNNLLDNQFKFKYLDNQLSIVNYDKIIHFDDENIIIEYQNKILKISGKGLIISMLLKEEMIIKGIIKNIKLGD